MDFFLNPKLHFFPSSIRPIYLQTKNFNIFKPSSPDRFKRFSEDPQNRWEDNQTTKLTHTKLFRIWTLAQIHIFSIKRIDVPFWNEIQTDRFHYINNRNKYSWIPWHFPPFRRVTICTWFQSRQKLFSAPDEKKNSSLSLSSKMGGWLPYHIYIFLSLSLSFFRSHMCYVLCLSRRKKLEQCVCYK